MKLIKMALVGLSLGSAVSFADDCTAPEMPNLPDGDTASMEEMLAGQSAVKAFQAANLEYMGCLDPKITAAAAAAGADPENEDAKATVKQLEEAYNAAVSKEEELAGAFNGELGEYREANPK